MSSNVLARDQHPTRMGAEVPVEHIRLLQPSFHNYTRNWWPSLVWLGIIRLESTDTASFDNTLGWLHTVLVFLFPHISGGLVWQLNEVLRKTGHFMGYGILSVLVFFALRYTNRDQLSPLLQRRWGTCLHDLWRMEWVLLGVSVTVITAALDEIHQSVHPFANWTLAGRRARYLRSSRAAGHGLFLLALGTESQERAARSAAIFLQFIRDSRAGDESRPSAVDLTV